MSGKEIINRGIGSDLVLRYLKNLKKEDLIKRVKSIPIIHSIYNCEGCSCSCVGIDMNGEVNEYSCKKFKSLAIEVFLTQYSKEELMELLL